MRVVCVALAMMCRCGTIYCLVCVYVGYAAMVGVGLVSVVRMYGYGLWGFG